ncbi:MAG TPA: acyloxyacyl hydrolase [Patescibacteria group bacterium]|nr:acyloxyacyl hydrolase [Patescibacteria group bacterium]
MTKRITVMVALLLAAAAPAWAFDAEQTFKKGTFVLSGEGAYGWQFNLENKAHVTYLEFYDVGVRFSLLPFDSVGKDRFWYGALEVGFEPLYQKYTEPKPAFWAGLASVLRYHFLGLGRVVPYLELGAAAGGTDLDIREIDSSFAFLLFGGLGASMFISDKTALYAGYRYQHVSNGNTSQPNRGFEAHVGVAGISFFFP